jgi:predicted nucleic acid-binding protein
MGRVVLDTSVLIAIDRDPAMIGKLLQAEEEYFVPEIAVAEYLVGAELASSPEKKANKLAKLEAFEKLVSVVNFGRPEAKAYALFSAASKRSGTHRTNFDMAIAASAFVLDAQIRTSDRAAKFEELPGITVSYF